MKIYTIKEISKLAGVSAGTVDRVLHKRGKVAPEKEARINAILKEIDYKPNQLARSLKMNKRHRLVALMPDSELDEYWNPCIIGINELKGELEDRGVFVEVLKYNPTSSSHFKEICEQSLELDPDGVLLGALFLNESKIYLNQLDKRCIPFNLINTAIEDSNYQTFVGQNLVQSGRIAAHLFDVFLSEKKSILIVHMTEEFENAFHMQQKELGFRAYFEEMNEHTKIKTLNIKANFQSTISKQLAAEAQEPLNGIFVTTSKANLVASANIDVPIIGYDLLKENIKNLSEGKIKFLIYQNPKLQAYQGLSYLTDHVLRQTQGPKQKFLPIEIISLENVSSYQV